MSPVVGRTYWVNIKGVGVALECIASGEHMSVFGQSAYVVSNENIIADTKKPVSLREWLFGKGGAQ